MKTSIIFMKTNIMAICALLCAAAALAQSGGVITGTIVDAQGGAALPKAPVHLKNAATGTSYSAQSAANGSYTLAGLPPGSYRDAARDRTLPPARYGAFGDRNHHRRSGRV